MNAPVMPPQGQPTAPPQMPAVMPPIATPAPAPAPTTHDVTIIRTKKYAQAKCEAVAPEEFGVSRNTRRLADCDYCFHKIPNHTEGTLIAQGFDAEQIKTLPTYSGADNSETLARDTVDEEFFAGDDSNRSARPIEVVEHYIRMDYKGDGKPCLYKVTTGGGMGEILLKTTVDDKGKKTKGPDIEEFDAIPFAAGTPIPQPHRFIGLSLADQVMPIQRVNTALMRSLLDNTYMVGNPRIEVPENVANVNTIEDLLTVRPNGIVRTKGAGGLEQLTTTSIVGDILPVITYMDGVREMRTGVTRQGQGVDADALQNQSATAVKQVFSATQARMKLIARNLAETLVKDLFWLLHATIRRHGQEAQTVKLRNTWVKVDPREWKSRDNLTVNVGLGSGGKAEQFAQLMALGNIQKEMLAGGKANLVGDQQLFNTAAEVTKVMGHKNPDKFFNDPSEKNPDGSPKHPPIPPPPDPKVQAAQIKGQIDQQANAQKAQLEQQKAQNDAIHQQVKTQAEIELAKIKADMEAKLAMLEAALKAQGEQQKMQHAHAQHAMDMKSKAVDMVATAHSHDAKTEQTAQSHDASMKQGEQSHKAKIEQMKAKPAKPNA